MNSFERTINKFRTAIPDTLPCISIDGKNGQARATFFADAGLVTVESSVHFEGNPFYIEPDDLKTIRRVDNLYLVKDGVFYGDLEVDLKVDSENMPMIALENEQEGLKVKRDDLDYIMLAASTDETRPVLNSILFTSKRLVATDGFRIHIVPGEYHTEDNLITILPSEALARIKSDFAISHKDDHSIIIFDDHDNRVIMKIPWIVGTFPDYHAIIPTETKIDFVLPNDKRFKKVVTDDFCKVILHSNIITFITWKIRENRGHTMFKITPGYTKGKPETEITFGINPRYLCEAIRGDIVKIGFNDSSAPIVIGNSIVMPKWLK